MRAGFAILAVAVLGDLSVAFNPSIPFGMDLSVVKRSWRPIVLRSSMKERSADSVTANERSPMKWERRSFIAKGALSIGLPLLMPNFAVFAAGASGNGTQTGGTAFEDLDRGFQLTIPNGWTQGTAEFPGANKSPARPRIVSFLSPQGKDTNIAIVSYFVQPDQSKLGSLGSIDDVARTVLGTAFNLDAEMYSHKQKDVGNGPAYIFDYRIDQRHLLTIFTLQAGAFGANSLVTVTMQSPAAAWGDVAATYAAVADSFRLSKL